MTAIGLTSLRIRRATIDDAKHLFAWRNDPLTRQMSRNQQPVEWQDHVNWLTGVLNNPDRILLIGEVDGEPVGTVRFDQMPGENQCEISWTVNPDYRGHGYGSRMSVEACRTLPKSTIFAEIRADNLPTLRMIEHCGFIKESEHDGVTHWRRAPLVDATK